MSELDRDARDMTRGILVNLVGYILKLAHPAGTAAVVWFYSESAFGLLVGAQAVLFVTMRVCLLGLDKGLHWWVPRVGSRAPLSGLRPTLLVAGAISTALALAIALFAAPMLAQWRGNPALEVPLRWMAVGLVPMTLAEVLIAAALGRRRMEGQAIVKEGVVPLAFTAAAVVGALVFGASEKTLAVAFVWGQLALLGGGIWAFRRAFTPEERVWPKGEGLRIPRPMWRYAIPMWGAEIGTSVLTRLDVLVLAALTDEAAVGVYGLVAMLSNTLRSIRRAFDPIVIAIISEADSLADSQRVRASVSQAAALILLTQTPVYAGLLAFLPEIIGVLRGGYVEAVVPALVLCAFWIVNGALGVQGMVVVGMGRSDIALGNALVTGAAQIGLLLWLVPHYHLVGAALAVGSAMTLHNVLWTIQARLLTGSFNVDRRVLWAIVATTAAMVTFGLVVLAVGGFERLSTRALAFGAFAVVQGALVLYPWRKGWFRPPRAGT